MSAFYKAKGQADSQSAWQRNETCRSVNLMPEKNATSINCRCENA